MSQFYLKIDLQEPVIFSESAASLGGHQSLDYISGASLLGVSASKLYASLGKDAFDVFHRGKVRFGNAYPLSSDNAECYPIPFVWFYAKGSAYKSTDNKLKGEAIFNLMNRENQSLPDNKQPKQLRTGYISHQLDHVSSRHSLRMKTAIDPKTARAASAQLFGYQSLEEGQSFLANIVIDNDLDPEIKRQVEESLQGTLFLGRSRSAQYGKVNSRVVTLKNQVGQSRISGNDSVLWLHSDLALTTKEGLPIGENTLEAALSRALGTLNQSGYIDWDKSSLRFRQYSPYNAYRNAYDMQRQVIEKGSVIYLKNVPADSFSKPTQYVGLYQAQGLGHIEINHPLLAGEHPASGEALQVITKEKASSDRVEQPSNDPLASWLSEKRKHQTNTREERQDAEYMGKQIKGLYENAILYAGIKDDVPIGPSASQWGLVSDVGKQNQSGGNSLKKALENICKPNDKDWSVTTFISKETGQQETTFSHWLLSNLDGKSGQVTSLVARIAQDYLKQPKLRSKI